LAVEVFNDVAATVSLQLNIEVVSRAKLIKATSFGHFFKELPAIKKV
jgi:hypothetical protein